MSFKSFRDMPKALRAQAASGLTSVVKMDPEQAVMLAEILEEYEFQLGLQMADAVQTAAKSEVKNC